MNRLKEDLELAESLIGYFHGRILTTQQVVPENIYLFLSTQAGEICSSTFDQKVFETFKEKNKKQLIDSIEGIHSSNILDNLILYRPGDVYYDRKLTYETGSKKSMVFGIFNTNDYYPESFVETLFYSKLSGQNVVNLSDVLKWISEEYAGYPIIFTLTACASIKNTRITLGDLDKIMKHERAQQLEIFKLRSPSSSVNKFTNNIIENMDFVEPEPILVKGEPYLERPAFSAPYIPPPPNMVSLMYKNSGGIQKTYVDEHGRYLFSKGSVASIIGASGIAADKFSIVIPSRQNRSGARIIPYSGGAAGAAKKMILLSSRQIFSSAGAAKKMILNLSRTKKQRSQWNKKQKSARFSRRIR